MEQGLTFLRMAWGGGAFDFTGDHVQLNGFELFPPPVQQHPPIYVGALADRAIERAARLADGYLLSAGSTKDEVRDRIRVYGKAVRDVGDSKRSWVGLNRVVHVVASRIERDQAIRDFGRSFLAAYDAWGHDDVRALGSEERVLQRTASEHFIIGEASECVEQIEEYADMGVEHLACLMSFGGPPIEQVEASLRLFGDEVLPELGD